MLQIRDLIWGLLFIGCAAAIQVQITPTQGEISVGESKFFLREEKITFQNAPTPQEFNEGDDADIVCDVVSSPPATIIWKYKGATIQASKDVRFKILSNGHLQIRGIKKTDEGMYNCEARVTARGEIDFRMMKVIVNVLPTIRVRQSEVNATADVGSSALLACDADGFPEPTVTWAHNNVVLESGEKYSLSTDGSELEIKDVKKVDEGDYTCIAKNKAGEKSEEVSLNVFVQPKITFLMNQTASEFEEQVTLTCEASGDPTPAISWSFGSRVFTEREQSLDRNVVVRSHARVSSLTLKNVQFTYAGQYLCTASNSIGQDNQHMYLEVRYAPKILGSVTVYTWEGNPANISCEVDAHPGAEVVWFRDGLQLPNANTTNMKVYNTPTISYLEITPDSQNDFGSYNCTATNVMGTESKEFILIQAEVPSSPEILQVEAFSSTALVEFEEPVSMGGVPIIKYRVEWRSLGQEWTGREYDAEDEMTSITITRLRPETTYEVKISAINGKGEGESSTARTFKTQPVRKPSAPKLMVSVQRGNYVKVNWIKPDDGGIPLTHYLVRYKARHASHWKPEIRFPSVSDYIGLRSLDWNTEYEFQIVAENLAGKSQPGTLSFRTDVDPDTIPEIQQVEPFSSTAVVEFEEPVSMGGVPIIKYRVEWRSLGQEWTGREYDAEDGMTSITITGLKPETTYEVRMSAINSKGEGESSTARTFKTLPAFLGFKIFQSLFGL